MRGQGARQTGFSAIAVVIAVLVVGVIAASGVLVYQHYRSAAKQTADTTSSQTTTQQKSTTTTQQQAAVTLDIKEWGVHMTLDSTTASMYYYINPQLPDVAYLSLKKISDISPDCAADKVSLGAISRLTTAEHQAALADPTKGDPGTTQIGTYWYGFSKPQGTCISPANDAAVQSTLPGYNATTIPNAFNLLAAD